MGDRVCLNVSIINDKKGRWPNGSAFFFYLGDCPFESDPSPYSADASGEVTGSAVSCQEVSRCSTIGGSLGMYIIFAPTKKRIRNRKSGVPVAPKKGRVSAKNFKQKMYKK